MSTLVTIDGIGFTVSDTWNPPPHIEYGRSDGGVSPIVGAIVAVDLDTIPNITDEDGVTADALIIDQAKVIGDIDYMSSTSSRGSGYNVRIDNIRIVTTYNGTGPWKMVFPSEGDITVVNTGQDYEVGDYMTFDSGDTYGTVTAVTS